MGKFENDFFFCIELGNGSLISHKEFIEWYGLFAKGLDSKDVIILRDLTMEIHKHFEPIHSNNGYNYMFRKDFELIVKARGLWMVIHHKLYMPICRIISFNMARRSIMEFKGKKMIWAMYDEHAN